MTTFQKIEVTKDGRVILTVKSGFAFEITAVDTPNGMYVSGEHLTDKMHLSGENKKRNIIGIYGEAGEN